MIKIAVIGTGYVGLVSGVCFAETGNEVICVDNNPEKLAKLQQGEITIYEPGLEILFQRNVREKRLSFTNDLAAALRACKIIFLALPTPPGEDGSADLSYILNVAEQIGHLIDDYKVIVDKSTVPVGTAEKVREVIAKNAKVDFDVVSNPEFLREGVAVEDFLKPDRVVIGTSSSKARELMKRVYEPYLRQGNPIIFMDERSAEMTKYAANSYLATRISFMNEVANLCEKVGANVDFVRLGIGSDKRIGNRFLFPGVGYGGSCFPKDVQALQQTAQQNDYDFKILNAVMSVNDRQKHTLAQKISNYFGGKLEGKKIAIWGLAFKPNTDDMREAPAIYIINDLLAQGASVTAFDPEAMPNAKQLFGEKISLTFGQYDALHKADALAIITEWAMFRTPDFEKMAQLLNNKLIFDGRNLYDTDFMRQNAWIYNSIGREMVA